MQFGVFAVFALIRPWRPRVWQRTVRTPFAVLGFGSPTPLQSRRAACPPSAYTCISIISTGECKRVRELKASADRCQRHFAGLRRRPLADTPEFAVFLRFTFSLAGPFWPHSSVGNWNTRGHPGQPSVSSPPLPLFSHRDSSQLFPPDRVRRSDTPLTDVSAFPLPPRRTRLANNRVKPINSIKPGQGSILQWLYLPTMLLVNTRSGENSLPV